MAERKEAGKKGVRNENNKRRNKYKVVLRIETHTRKIETDADRQAREKR